MNNPDLVRRLLSEVMPGDSTVQLDKSFGKFAKQHGWASFETELTAVIEVTTAQTIARNAQLLLILCTLRDKNAQRIELCSRLCGRVVQAIEAFDSEPDGRDWRIRQVDRAVLLRSLVTAMLAVGANGPLGRLIDHALSCDRYDLTDAHLAAIFTLELEKHLAKPANACPPISKWLSSCRCELERRTAEPPRKPADYRREGKLSCPCSDCLALAKFLGDPNQREARFPLAKDRRQHLHQVIEGNRCDCTHDTERRGRPYTLVCTKTTASYEAACAIHQRDMENLQRVAALETKLS